MKKMFINKKIVSLCFFIVLINNHIAFSYWFGKEPWYVELKKIAKLFFNNEHNEHANRVKEIKQQHQTSFDNLLREQFSSFFSITTQLEKLIQERRQKKEEFYDNLYSFDAFGYPIKYNQIIEQLSAEQIKLFRKIGGDYGVNAYAIAIISDDFAPDIRAKVHLMKDKYPVIILNKNIVWSAVSDEFLTEIFHRNIQDLVDGYIFDNETLTMLLKKTHSKNKTSSEVKIFVEKTDQKYSQLKNETRKRISEVYQTQ